MRPTWTQIEELASRFRERLDADPPQAAIVAGSGVQLEFPGATATRRFAYEDLLPFPVDAVHGHSLSASLWEGSGARFLCLHGRLHHYQGFDLAQVTLMTRVVALLGIRVLAITNAAGGLEGGWPPGTLMMLTDHLNLMGGNPLIGDNYDEAGPRFPDLSEPYSRRLAGLARQAAAEIGVRLTEGVYVALTGPSYETPAEVRMLRQLGAHAVGMSTVPEVIVARHMGLEVVAFSVITNPAAGLSPNTLNHEEVVAASNAASGSLSKLLLRTLEKA